ncbi:MAG: hypothetical protein WCG25_04725 [bacterium]
MSNLSFFRYHKALYLAHLKLVGSHDESVSVNLSNVLTYNSVSSHRSNSNSLGSSTFENSYHCLIRSFL